MSYYICILNSKSPRVTTGVNERFATCYSDDRVMVFDADVDASIVATWVRTLCDKHDVGCIVVPMQPGRFFVHGVTMSRCFGDARLTFSDEAAAREKAARSVDDLLLKR